MKRYLLRALPAALFALCLLALVLSEALYHADMLLCDSVYRKLESRDRAIKIIAIDEATEAAYGKFDSYSREKSAELAELLFADPEAAPAVLVYDIMFIGESDPATDARLAAAVGAAGRVVCASHLVYGGRMETEEDGTLVYNPAAIEREERPYAALDAVSRVGFANNCISRDNIVRSAQLTEQMKGETRDSLAYTAYLAYMEALGQAPDLPNTQDGQTGFFYAGNPGDIPHVSLVDVLEGRVPAGEFEDCLVLVGAYAPGFGDAYYTSVTRGEQMYGVEINANIVRALMMGKLADPVPLALYAALSAALFALWVFFLGKQRLWAVLCEAAVLIAAHLLLGRWLAISGYLIPQAYFILAVLAAVIYHIIRRYVVEKLRRRQAVKTLKKYVAPQIVDKLTRNGGFELRLGGEKKHIAVLFVDVRGFTTLSEALPPEEVVSMLNRYLSVTTEAVFRNEGTLDKFIGDATMAVFNAPFDQDDYLYRAVKTAWDIQRGVAALGASMDRPIHVGVGVNCGEAVVGNIGCEVRMDYTAIGDTVNTAARLESNAKPGQILISEAVYLALTDRIQAEPVGELSLKGKQEKVTVYQVTNIKKGGDLDE